MTFIPLRRATRTLFRSRSKVWHEARSIHNAPSRKFVSGSAAAMQVEGASPLVDTFGREHNYLRISLTERCNLRCQYCMPDEGIDLTPNPELLTKDEIVRLARLFVDQGVDKIRLTGGEPLVHPHVEEICEEIGGLEGLNTLAITTNGIVLSRKLPRLVDAGVNAFNISLDSLVDRKFEFITRRKGFSRVMSAIEDTINAKAGPVKVNCVVTRGFNEDEVVDFVEYTRDKEVEVRFIEYMPFDGNKWNDKKLVKYTEMLSMIDDAGLVAHRVKDHPNDTSKTYQVEGFKGKIGFITSMSDNFCSTCNRIRLTADGNLKVCLFGPAEVSLRDVMREHSIPSGESGDVGTLALDETGTEALVDVIGCAVRGKKARHAGMYDIAKNQNRPMIKIGG